uniref:LO6 n=1 Tax=Swordtail adomavirus 1 TaxID=2609876 RepID=A0A6F9EY57_9VIRU|nr:TPA_asm: LO6 [Swordtail adomavirus 1]
MSYRGQGLGPVYRKPEYDRGHGLGPFRPNKGESRVAGGQWLQQTLNAKGWKHRRSKRGAGFKDFMKRAWSSLKQNLFPKLQEHGSAFLKHAANHAVTHGADYYAALKKDGVGGVKNMFMDHAPGVVTDFVRQQASRGSGEVCDALTTCVQTARPMIASLLSSEPLQHRHSTVDQAGCRFLTGRGGLEHDLVAAAPLQAAYDMALGAALQQGLKHEGPRGGFLPLLIPAIAGILSATISQVPKFVELARGKGITPYNGFKPDQHFPNPYIGHNALGKPTTKRGAGSVHEAHTDTGSTFKLSRTETPSTPIKVTIRKAKSGKGRPSQRTLYAGEGINDLF